jgi:hypothetical protein
MVLKRFSGILFACPAHAATAPCTQPKPGHTSTVASKSHLRIKHRGTTRRCQGKRRPEGRKTSIVRAWQQGYIGDVGSKTFDGVWFMAYIKDHLPPHVHAFYAGTQVILELDFDRRVIRIARRVDRIEPRNAKKSDVKRIQRVADLYSEQLFELWKKARNE